MNNSRQLARICMRSFSKSANKSTSSTQEVAEVPSKAFAKLKEKQKKFGIEDGLPVYLKGGFGDRILYLITVGMVAYGSAMSFKVWYDLS